MSLVEIKEVIKILATGTTSLTIMFFIALYAIAKITYKKAHKVKKTKKVHKAKRNMNVMFNIDSKNKTLQEIQLEKAQMIKILGGI